VNEAGGTVGDRYALLERIGSGAMGVVWRARDELLHREVAMKQLRLPDLGPAESEVARTRAMREARIAARLHHPNAITVFDVVVENDQPWLVMEYLPSRSLAALLAEQGPLDPVETARIGGHVAAALSAAHAAGIVHRDVKPANVLIGHNGAVKLTDFGISRAAGDGTLTDKGMISGTPAYLAPEVARGESPNPLSDVFSLGATLYAATERKSPYGHSDNSLGLLYRAAIGQIDSPANAGPLTGPMNRLLAGNPAERPTSAQVIALLAAVGAEPTAISRPVSTPVPVPAKPKDKAKPKVKTKARHQSGPKPRKPRRRLLLVAVVAGVLLVSGIAGAISINGLPFGPGASSNTGFDQPPQQPFTPTEAANFVVGHYATLVQDPRAAWENLAPTYRRPFEEYQRDWSQYDSVQANGNPEVYGDGPGYFVDILITLTKNGAETVNTYRIGVRKNNGRVQIVSSALRETPASDAATP